MGAMMGAGGYGRFGTMGGVSDAVLQKLGLTADHLIAERYSRKSLAQIAQERGVAKASLVAAMVAELQAYLDAQVKAGALTQAQADALQALMQQHVAQAAQAAMRHPHAAPATPATLATPAPLVTGTLRGRVTPRKPGRARQRPPVFRCTAQQHNRTAGSTYEAQEAPTSDAGIPVCGVGGCLAPHGPTSARGETP